MNAEGNVPEDLTTEFRNSWKGVQAVLKEAGTDLNGIIEFTSFHVGLQSHMEEFMAIRDEFLSEPWPAWTAIGVAELAAPGAHLEIKVTARAR